MGICVDTLVMIIINVFINEFMELKEDYDMNTQI